MIQHKKGFSLLELLIVLSIFTIMTTVLVANHRRFGNNIILSGLADDVALSIREAQSFSLGSKRVDGIQSDEEAFRNPYGVYINQNNQYTLFADTNDTIDGYDEDDEILRVYTFPSGNTISHFCVVETGGDTRCSHEGADPIIEMSITFLRPNPDARIISDDQTFTQGLICLVSQTGKEKQVEVLSSGQIQVVDVCE